MCPEHPQSEFESSDKTEMGGFEKDELYGATLVISTEDGEQKMEIGG